MTAHSLLAVFLIVVVPISDIWSTRWLKRSTDPAKKIKAYTSTIALLWLACAAAWRMDHPGFLYAARSEDRLKWMPGSGFVYGVVAAFYVGLLVQVLMIRYQAKAKAAYQRQAKKLDFFLPFTGAERVLFAAVSLTAGICEEVLYRGFLYHYFRDFWHWGVVAAVVVAAIAFGLAHGYQGIAGIVATALIGAVMAVLYLGTGTLLLPMIFHAFIDLRVLLLPMPDISPDATLAAST